MMSALSEDAAADLLDQATALAAVGDAGAAGELAREAAALLPPDDPERPEVFMLAAQLLDQAGRASDAADSWAQCAAESYDDALRARALNAEGQSARLAGDWARAASAHARALELAESTFGETPETAAIAQNLAMVFKYTGRFDESEALYRRALAIAETASDERLVAIICHNLGGLAHARGDHASGIPWARRSVAVRERLNDDLGLAGDRGALAGLLIEAGELDEATELLHAARAVFVAHLGRDDHEVGVVDGNLATIALRRGDLRAAERHARSALALKERRLGKRHPELAVTLTTLGTIRRRRGDGREAVALHRRAHEVLAAAVAPDHPLLRTIEENLEVARAEPSGRPARRR